MGSTKREDARETVVPPRGAEPTGGDDRSLGASGIRVDRDRETTPAPASAVTATEWAAFPSARPTSVPDYDVAAHAFESSLRHHALPHLPLDVAIPTRTGVAAPADLELRASFLLLHVDGRSSVREIGELTSLPVDEVLTCFLGLTAAGLITLGGTQQALGIPISGERSRSGA